MTEFPAALSAQRPGSVVGAPWTPMLATVPPGRTTRVQMSKVPGVPTASIATSAPSPPSVSAVTCCSAFASAALIVTSAPNRRVPAPDRALTHCETDGGRLATRPTVTGVTRVPAG